MNTNRHIEQAAALLAASGHGELAGKIRRREDMLQRELDRRATKEAKQKARIDSQTAPDPATVTVNAGALEALRAKVDRVDLLNERARRGESTYGAQGALLNVVRAARRLLEGGE